MSELLMVEDLRVWLRVERARRQVLDDVSLAIAPGEAIGLVGESGWGKSMTARAIGRLLPRGAETEGSIRFGELDVPSLRGAALRRYRMEGIATVFQDPRAHINPVRRIGDFVTEGLRTNLGMREDAALRRAAELLEDVGIDDPERRLRQYPHELSGGMLQRVMFATALTSEPQLLLADEPTTALDVTTQAEVMAIIVEQRARRGLAMLFITHDLDLAAAVCDRTYVMYAGRIVETQAARSLHERPLHPYTAALVRARPDVHASEERLAAIPGRPVSAFDAPAGCAFAPRCPYVRDECRAGVPPLLELGAGASRCVRARELSEELAHA